MSTTTKTKQELDMLDRKEERLRLGQLTKPIDWMMLAAEYEEILQAYLLATPSPKVEVERIREIIATIYDQSAALPPEPVSQESQNRPDRGGTIQPLRYGKAR